MNSELIRLKEVSKLTSLSTTTLRRMIKRHELQGVLIGGNYYVRPNDYYEFIYNIECKKLGVTPNQMKQIVKEEQDKRNVELFKQMGIDKLDKDTQDFIMTALTYIK